MNIISKICGVAAMALSLLGGTAASAGTIDDIRSRGVLRIPAILNETPYFNKDPRTGEWSARMLELLRLDRSKFAPLRNPVEIVGKVTAEAARETGLRAGTPVLVGCGDYPAALLGSGVCRPGIGSEVMGTSAIITAIAERPLLDALDQQRHEPLITVARQGGRTDTFNVQRS